MHRRDLLPLGLLLPLAAGVFLAGIGWGLPSPGVNAYLFGNHPVWSGQRILQLAGTTQDPNRGADVASHAGVDRREVVVVNATDQERARIVRRYRLMSYQPDEWNTLKALSEMKPRQGNFDPKLYQYGGLWVYPAGAMLKLAGFIHAIELRSDMAWYLDHPEAFARFYIIVRLWSVCWAMIGVAAAYLLVRRIAGGWMFPSAAAICFMTMPVVINMAHEAKPHLAGAVLMLLAVLAAARYVETGRRSAWMTAGALCGAALGMVLSALPIFLVLPGMSLLRAGSWRSKIGPCAGAIVIGIGVYLISNPYVAVNLVRNRAVLQSNLGNSREMYHPQLTAAGIANAAYLVAAGTSPLLALAGAAAAIALAARAVRHRKNTTPPEVRRRATGLLLALPAVCVMGQCLFFATGKPGEFGRFLLAADIFLLIEAIVAIPTFVHNGPMRAAAGLVLVGATAFGGFWYERAFVRDARPGASRRMLADRLRDFQAAGGTSLAVYADPAPYCLPPVNVFDWQIRLLPKDARPADGVASADVSVQAVDAPADSASLASSLFTGTPISWADKPFEVRKAKR